MRLITHCVLWIALGCTPKKSKDCKGNCGAQAGAKPEGVSAITAAADLKGAFELLLVTPSTQGQASLLKIDRVTGEIQEALTQDRGNSTGQRALPELFGVAISPTQDVYLHFKEPFIYKDVPAGEDASKQANGYQCQIFKIKGGTLGDLVASTPGGNNLECLNNQLFVDGGQEQKSALQFDQNGNIYYLATHALTSKRQVYKMLRNGSGTTVAISTNVCVRDFLVMENGAIYYTAQSCEKSIDEPAGFFRYVSPGVDGPMIEISRDWWNFDVRPLKSGVGIKDAAIFFGPDPREASTASWNTACLFDFDPTKSTSISRIRDVVTCDGDLAAWVELRRGVDVAEFGEGYENYRGSDPNHSPSLVWRSEFARRCESEGEIFSGKGRWASIIQQAGDLYVVGTLRKKKARVLSSDQRSCTPPGAGSVAEDPWSSELKALSKVDREKKSLVILSQATEQALNLWFVDGQLFYSSFDTQLGQYLLSRLEADNTRQIILTDFEAYHLGPSGAAGGGLLVDGLDLSVNQYKFGVVDIAKKVFSEKKGLTGVLRAVLVLP